MARSFSALSRVRQQKAQARALSQRDYFVACAVTRTGAVVADIGRNALESFRVADANAHYFARKISVFRDGCHSALPQLRQE
jgi:precorrin-6x reductase